MSQRSILFLTAIVIVAAFLFPPVERLASVNPMLFVSDGFGFVGSIAGGHRIHLSQLVVELAVVAMAGGFAAVAVSRK